MESCPPTAHSTDIIQARMRLARETATDLRTKASMLADRLADAANGLKTRGELPSPCLATEVEGLRSEFAQLAEELSELGGNLGTGPDRQPTLDELDDRWRQINSDCQRSQIKAISTTLDVVARLARCDGGICTPLESCRQLAIKLLANLRGSDGDPGLSNSMTWVEQVRPLAALGKLVQHRTDMSGDEIVRLRRTEASEIDEELWMLAMHGEIVIGETTPGIDSPTESLMIAEPESPVETPATRPPATAPEMKSELPSPRVSPSEADNSPKDEPAADDNGTLPITSVTAEENQKSSADAADFAAEATSSRTAAAMVSQENSLAAVCAHISQIEGPPPVEVADKLMWLLLKENRLDIAFHAARWIEGQALECAVPATLVECLVLGQCLHSTVGATAGRLCEALERLSVPAFWQGDAADEESLNPCRLLALAAALEPTLLLQGSRAVDILKRLSIPVGDAALRELRGAVLIPTEQNFVLSPALLREDGRLETWQHELKSLRQRCANWLEQNRQCKVIFAATTQVWHRWLTDTGPFGRLLTRMIEGHADSDPASLLQESAVWREDKYIDSELHRTDRELRGRDATRKPIEARAVTAIRGRCHEATALVSEWASLLNRRSNKAADWEAKQVAECRSRLTTVLPKCDAALEALEGGRDRSLELQAAVAVVRRVLDNLRMLLKRGEIVDEREVPPAALLNAWLLRHATVELDNDWQPTDSAAPEVLAAIIEEVTTCKSWQVSLEDCWHRQDFERAGWIVQFRQQDSNETAVDEWRIEQDRQLDESRRAVSDQRDALLRRINESLLKGLIEEPVRLNLTAQWGTLDPAGTLNLGELRRQLNSLEIELRRLCQATIDQFRRELADGSLRDRNPDGYCRLLSVAEAGDLFTAHEYLAILEAGGHLPETSLADAAVEFFPEFYQRVETAFFGQSKLDLFECVRVLQTRATIGECNVSQLLTPEEGKNAASIFDDWRKLKTSKSDPHVAVRKLFEFLGFRVERLLPQDEQFQRFSLVVVPLQSRDDCPLPDFGSKTGGHYTVVLLSKLPLENEILQQTKCDGKPVVIALFFGAMDQRRRRALAHELRKHPARRVLVLDEVLLMYVCLQKRRLRAFFQAAAGFCVAEPYSTASGQVPIEMFYGRTREIEQVFDPDGTNLVYGGRQLGKSALLWEVERRYHRPGSDIIVQRIDLEYGERLGRDKPLDDIWIVIAKVLQPFQIVGPNTRKPDSIQQAVLDWLAKDDRRRIVLLLDEADHFLESDAKESWKRVGQLKTLMEHPVSRRRFKVVFAGLHNVQRTSHDTNTPLAHLGDPVCVGPFLGRDEIRDATQMIEGPFRAMGYRFQSLDLIGRILAQANFYPSLIQLICRELLKYLAERSSQPTNGTPPYEIRLQDIESTHANSEVQKQIRERFRWTRELDNRYKILTLCIALETLSEPAVSYTGVDVDTLRQWAFSLWARGFERNRSHDDFRSLLLEMVELGVLREVSPARHALRSPNLLALLGSREEIERGLDDATKASPESSYEAAEFRRILDVQAKWRRSPLTASQESQLLAAHENALFVMFGTLAAGLDQVRSSLEKFAESPDGSAIRLSSIDDCKDIDAFERRLIELFDARSENEPNLMLVAPTPNCQWTREWVQRAGELLKKRGGTKRLAKIIFLAGSGEAWAWSSVTPGQREQLLNVGLREIQLTPWSAGAVDHWKRDAELGDATPDDGLRVRKATGHWSWFLHELGRQAVNQNHQWRESVEHFQRALGEDEAALARFDLRPEALPLIEIMANFGEPVTIDDLRDLADGSPPNANIATVLRWGDLMQLVTLGDEGRWSLDPFLRSLLLARHDHAT